MSLTKPKTGNQKPETEDQRPKTRSQKQKAGNQKQKIIYSNFLIQGSLFERGFFVLRSIRLCSSVFGFWSLIFGFVLTLSGCASLGAYNPATGRSEFIFISTAEEVSMGQSIHQQLLTRYALAQDKEAAERIEEIGQRLAQVSDRQDYAYHFFLVESEELNAFTIPGGNIYFFTGLLEHMDTDDQIASVLAHEIGHCSAKHTVKKYQAALGYSLIGSLVLSGMESASQQVAQMSSDVVMNLVFSAYGRRDEFEADRLGLKYMVLADYDTQGMIETFEILKQESRDAGPSLILRSHPYLEDRIKEAELEAGRVRQEFE